MNFSVESEGRIISVDIDVDTFVVCEKGEASATEAHPVNSSASQHDLSASSWKFRRVAATRLRPTRRLECLGSVSAGGIGYLLMRHNDRLYVGVGSDHDDPVLARENPALSKQLFDKPCSQSLWLLNDVERHWGSLELHARIHEKGTMVTYQRALLSDLPSPASMIETFSLYDSLENGTAMFVGSVPVIGAVRTTDRFSFSMFDPRLNRTLSGSYYVVCLPVRA